MAISGGKLLSGLEEQGYQKLDRTGNVKGICYFYCHRGKWNTEPPRGYLGEQAHTLLAFMSHTEN